MCIDSACTADIFSNKSHILILGNTKCADAGRAERASKRFRAFSHWWHGTMPQGHTTTGPHGVLCLDKATLDYNEYELK